MLSAVSSWDDIELARRIAVQVGEAAAAEQKLRMRMVPRIRLFAFQRLGDPQAAEAVADHVLARIIAALRRGEVSDLSRLGHFVLHMTRQAVREREGNR